MSLKQQVVSGVKWTSLSRIAIMIIQILQISILARYLSSSDFGQMSIAMVIIGFGRMFSDMGISNAIIYKQETSDRQLSSLYWLNIFSGVILFLVVSGFSPLIARFYNEPELTELIIILSTTFIIIAIGNQYRILFQKVLNFNLMSKIEITAALGGFIVSIASAVKGMGVYALVYGTLASAIISSTLFFFYGLRVHRPSLVYNYQEIKEYIGFGVYQMGGNTFNFFSTQLDAILIGKLLGMDALGVYSIVKQLVMRPSKIINPIITKVAFPLMAKVQDDMGQLKTIYLKIIRAVASINIPVYIAIAILAEPIIMIMFGEKWRAGIPVLSILSVYAMFRANGNPVGSLLMATGRVDLNLYFNAFVFFAIPIIVFTGSKFGITGVAWSLTLFQISLTIPGWYFMIRNTCGAGFTEYYRQIAIPLILGLLSGSIAYFGLLVSDNYILQVVVVGTIGLLSYALLTVYFNKNFMIILKIFK